VKIPQSVLYNRLQEGKIKRKKSRIKPTLTPIAKLRRIQFVLDFIDERGTFNDMKQYVHIDEKMFQLTKAYESYYMLPDEEVPHRHITHKCYITKVMFIAAVARPRYDYNKGCWFNGLIGIWPFTYKTPAIRNSKLRPAGTMETKAIGSIDRHVYKEYVLNKVLPAIMERWPKQEKKNPIYIQEDNCRIHTTNTRVEVKKAAKKKGFKIEVRPQPASSPDFNILDLGFFNAIQALKDQESCKDVDALVGAVE
jgi:hypothetical protein